MIPATALERAPQRWPEPAFAAVVLGTLGAAVLAQGMTMTVLHVSGHRYDTVQLTLTYGVRETVALLALGFLAKRYLGIAWAGLGVRAPSWRQIAIGAAAGIVVAALSYYVLSVTGARNGGTVDIIARAVIDGAAPWRFALCVIVAVYSPVVQEIVFRGLILRGLLQCTHAAVAIVVSAAIFALVHAGAGGSSVLDAFFFGVVSGALYLRFRSLTAPIAAHIAVNSWSVLSLLYAVSKIRA